MLPLPALAINRLWALSLALLLGHAFVYAPIRGMWRDHLLVKDGQEGMALITKEHWAGHGVVVYKYRVGQAVYTGQDHRSIQNPTYAHVMPGEKSVVYFSSSHPWISAINLPRRVVIEGLPVVLLVWLIEAGLIVTVINPNSGWAFRLNGKRQLLVAEKGSELQDANIIANHRRSTFVSVSPSTSPRLRRADCVSNGRH